MNITTDNLVIETWTYLGRRLTQSDAVRYVWLHEQASEGENNYLHHKQVVANAAVGSRWDFTVQVDGSYFVKGENRPQFREQLVGDQVIQWEIRDKGAAATKQMLANAKKAAVNREGLQELLAPLIREMRKVRNFQERSAIIAVVIDILYST